PRPSIRPERTARRSSPAATDIRRRRPRKALQAPRREARRRREAAWEGPLLAFTCIVRGMDREHPLRLALTLILLSGLFFSSLDATAKYLVRDHTLFVVVWARYAGQMVVTTPIAWHRA